MVHVNVCHDNACIPMVSGDTARKGRALHLYSEAAHGKHRTHENITEENANITEIRCFRIP